MVTVTRDGVLVGEYTLGLGAGAARSANAGGYEIRLLGLEGSSASLLVQAGEQVVDASTRFAFDLLARLRDEGDGDNLFLSPFSISMALAMTYNGASGATREAMASALRLDAMDRATVNDGNSALLHALAQRDPTLRTSVANSLWVRQGTPFDSAFVDRVRRAFDAETTTLDFADPAAVARINGWVSDKTEGKIPKVLDRITPDEVLFLINAIYFNGAWQTPFEEKQTRDQALHLGSGRAVTVPLMHRTGNLPFMAGDGFDAVRLPYRGDASTYVFLPDEASSLGAFLDRLDAQTWAEWRGRFEQRRVNLALPRFAMAYEARR